MMIKLFLLVVSLCVVSGQVMQACSADNTDCSCKDITYSICHNPPASQELHVGSLAECIQNCDLFGTFDQCNFLLYWETGPDENCKLIADTTLDQYLGACGVVGQPLRDAYGTCMSSTSVPDLSCSLFNCDTTDCHVCDTSDLCGLYTQTECEKLGNPGETSYNLPSFQTCLTLCTSQQQSNPFTYVTYDKESQECICYPDGLNQCTITAVPFGMSLEEVEHCDGCLKDEDCPVERPICSVLTGRCVECEKTADCGEGEICEQSSHVCIPDDCGGCTAPTPVCDQVSGNCYQCVEDADCPAETPSCDQSEHVCKPECAEDSDCGDDDYCDCTEDLAKDECPNGGVCAAGCRGVGSECTMTTGDTGVCNGGHVCIQYGDSTLTTITLVTKECSGCKVSRARAGATISMASAPPLGNISCTTNILDKIGRTDYEAGVEAPFSDETYLGKCFQFGLSSKVGEFKVSWNTEGTWTPEKFILERRFGLSSKVGEFKVSWNTEGTWTPEKFILERRFGEDWPYCCYNNEGLTVSKGQDQTFICEDLGTNC